MHSEAPDKLYVPAVQFAQSILRVLDEYLPSAQRAQVAAFTALYFPLSQSAHATDLVTGA